MVEFKWFKGSTGSCIKMVQNVQRFKCFIGSNYISLYAMPILIDLYSGETFREELPSLMEVLSEKCFEDGVLAILCENVVDILKVEELIGSLPSPSDGYKNMTVYNPKKPHCSERTIISNFLKNLRNQKPAEQRTGTFFINS